MSATPLSAHPNRAHPRTFNGIQALRGFAAAIVVGVHASRFWSWHVTGNKEALMWSAGNAGVDIFFVISGFVMALTTAKENHQSHPGVRFFLRRAARLYPMCWLMTLLWIASGWRGKHWTSTYILGSFLLVPANGPSGPVGPIIGGGWTLVYEMFFYALVTAALVLRVRPMRLLPPLLVVLALLSPLAQGSHWAVAALASPLLLEFLAGMFLAAVFTQLLRIPQPILVLGGAAAIATIFLEPLPLSNWQRALTVGLPSALLVASVIGLERSLGSRMPRIALLIGNASYVLYLTHLFTLNRINHLPLGLDRAGDTRRIHEIIYILLIFALATVIAITVHKLIEVPIQKKLSVAIRRFEQGFLDPAPVARQPAWDDASTSTAAGEFSAPLIHTLP